MRHREPEVLAESRNIDSGLWSRPRPGDVTNLNSKDTVHCNRVYLDLWSLTVPTCKNTIN